MIVRFLILLLAFSPFTSSLDAGLWDSITGIFKPRVKTVPPLIKVLILNDASNVTIEVKGKYNIYDPNNKAHLASSTIGKKNVMQSIPSGLKWGEEFPGVYQLHIVPENQLITSVVNGAEYKGSLYVYDIGGTISIVNSVDLEDYLSSILTPKYKNGFSEEALAALAITSRTYAYYRTLHPKNPFWGVDAEQVGYKGEDVVDYNSLMERSIQNTRYMVLSLTGTYEGTVTPIAAQWGSGTGSLSSKEPGVFSRISLYEAEEMGKSGAHAAQILSKAFPNTHIELVY